MSISEQVKAPDCAETTARLIDGILIILASAEMHMRAMRRGEAEQRGYHNQHFDSDIAGALDQAAQLKNHMLKHYPSEAEEWRRLTAVMNLAMAVSPAAKVASFSHLLQTIMYDAAHAQRHFKAMLGDTDDESWNFDADHADKHTRGAQEHARKLYAHVRDNYPAEAQHLGRALVPDEPSLSTVSISRQVMDLGWESQLRDPRGRWTTSGGLLSKQVHPEGFSLDPRTGRSPTGGFMVSLPGHTHQYPDSVMKDERQLADAIDQMLMSEKEIFKGHDVYLGGWVSDGKLWLDPSENIADRDQAVRIGRSRDQVAIWDVQGGQEIDTGGSGGDVTEHAAAHVLEGSSGVHGAAGGGAQGGGSQPRSGIAAQAGWVDLGAR